MPHLPRGVRGVGKTGEGRDQRPAVPGRGEGVLDRIVWLEPQHQGGDRVRREAGERAGGDEPDRGGEQGAAPESGRSKWMTCSYSSRTSWTGSPIPARAPGPSCATRSSTP